MDGVGDMLCRDEWYVEKVWISKVLELTLVLRLSLLVLEKLLEILLEFEALLEAWLEFLKDVEVLLVVVVDI